MVKKLVPLGELLPEFLELAFSQDWLIFEVIGFDAVDYWLARFIREFAFFVQWSFRSLFVFDLWLNKPEFFVAHSDEILIRFRILSFLLLVQNTQTVEIFIKSSIRKLFFVSSHLCFEGSKILLHFFYIILKG